MIIEKTSSVYGADVGSFYELAESLQDTASLEALLATVVAILPVPSGRYFKLTSLAIISFYRCSYFTYLTKVYSLNIVLDFQGIRSVDSILPIFFTVG